MLHLEHFDLGQAFDWHFQQGAIRGWGAAEDGSGPLRVSIGVGDEELAAGIAALHRPDLVGIFDDPALGFDIAIDFDLHILLREGIRELRIRAVAPSGQEAGVQLVPVAEAVIAMWRNARETSPLRCYGRGFVIDNRDEFAAGLPLMSDVENDSRLCGLIFVKLAAFGDFLWWKENEPGVLDCLRPLERIGPRAAAAAAAGKLLIVLDMSNEGQACAGVDYFLHPFHAALGQRGIPLDRCVLITQNRRFAEDYQARWPDGMRVLTHDYYIRRFAGLQNKASTAESLARRVAAHLGQRGRLRERAYLCMNFTPRTHRIATLSHIFGSGLDQRGFLSFAGFDTIKMKVSQSGLPEDWEQTELLATGLARLQERGRMTLDLPPEGDTSVPEFKLGDQVFYDESYFSLVTESEVAPRDLERITEKVIKPMAMFHPVVIVGNCNSLDLLRELGFRTFSPFVDESYDAIEDPQQRFRAAMVEFERLLAMNAGQMCNWYDAMSDILVHNFFTANTLLDRWYRHVAEPNLFRALADAAEARGAA
ncbi:hypothetical protein [Sphingomonas nostoxanthinifaciens]|uniref:hypothetical protein n=1 Tax=Sphingomonas nostoxanthinifaciens TaxID=2872652 RepID=UPI001CC1C693|nr:hypothetical protein [Sphingomonas nostoxanthinifaciens]UAK25000.1 hypothetical protein K8P63_01940 [Sphingomonas nostoxanthinifaciens]